MWLAIDKNKWILSTIVYFIRKDSDTEIDIWILNDVNAYTIHLPYSKNILNFFGLEDETQRNETPAP